MPLGSEIKVFRVEVGLFTLGPYRTHGGLANTPLLPHSKAARNLQALQREHPSPRRALAGAFRYVRVSRQQLVVETADRVEPGRGLCWVQLWVRDDLQDVALQRQDENLAHLHRGRRVSLGLLQQVEAIIRKAKHQGRPPRTHDRAAVLPGE